MLMVCVVCVCRVCRMRARATVRTT
jgi:hypothetical protein